MQMYNEATYKQLEHFWHFGGNLIIGIEILGFSGLASTPPYHRHLEGKGKVKVNVYLYSASS